MSTVLMGKLLESGTLAQQAANQSKEKFAASPDLDRAMTHAVMEAREARALMNVQALKSPRVMDELKDVQLNVVGLYESLRDHAGCGDAPV